MTNGSSQGLFVVVAVVIFGIFVSISYLLFRDTLTPNLASIFKDAIIGTENNLSDFYEYEGKKINFKNSLISSKITTHGLNEGSKIEALDATKGIGYHLEANNKGSVYGIKMSKHNDIVEGNTFLVSFKIEMLEGNSQRLGGHITGFGYVDTVFINNKEFKSNWHSAVNFTFTAGNSYDVLFFVEIIEDQGDDPNFYIQLDRGLEGISQKYNILDLKFQKVLQREGGEYLND